MAKPKRANPVWDDVITDLKGLAATLKKGGVDAAAAKYSVRRPKANSSPRSGGC